MILSSPFPEIAACRYFGRNLGNYAKPTLALYGKKSKQARAILTLSSMGEDPELWLRDEKGNLRVSLGLAGETGLTLYGEHWNSRAKLYLFAGHPLITFHDENGKIRTVFGYPNDFMSGNDWPEMYMGLLNKDEKIIWKAP